ncbi:MAG TPA: heavy-metal-associated domain-containing protein [Miltoncostaeaceae bacterium]|nr:heavy-metal-associated domain-containing protein [Miltoncostaeaceae bacterium]
MSDTTTQLHVPEISCAHCKTAIEGAVGGLAGVASAEVDVAARTVTVRHDAGAAPRSRIVRAIEDEGYEVPAGAEGG